MRLSVSTRAALVAAFVANGLGGPSFLARLAERQRDLGLSDAALGLAVLGLALGALLASPVAGWSVHRFGSRRVTVASGLGIGATLWLTAAAPNGLALFAALVVLGATDAGMDIGMNANGAAHEMAARRSVLHGLHAAWSFGALGGAGIAAVAASAGMSLAFHLALVGAVIAALSLLARPSLVATDPPPEPALVERRPRTLPLALVVLGVATIAAAFIEGTAGDWSAVQVDRLGLDTSLAPLGTAAFMAGMVLGRLVGDRRTDHHGAVRVLRRGMVWCAAGLALGSAWGEPLPFLVGIAVAGAGVAAFFPLAFSAAARVPGIAGGAASAIVSLGARAGFLVEPVLVGSISEAIDLRAAFAVAGVVALGVAVAARRIAAPSG